MLDAGWDGEWFLRAYDAAGEKVGSKECEEGKIFIEPQGFCVLAEIGVKEGLAEKALTSVKKYSGNQVRCRSSAAGLHQILPESW